MSVELLWPALKTIKRSLTCDINICENVYFVHHWNHHQYNYLTKDIKETFDMEFFAFALERDCAFALEHFMRVFTSRRYGKWW